MFSNTIFYIFSDNSVIEEDRNLTVNKKSKMINTYSKCLKGSNVKTSQLTGSLSDRLQLIDTTPTGDDPYQLGEADMREQSPIPKLMLQKTNHGRMKIYTGNDSTATSSAYTPTITNRKESLNKIKLNNYSVSTNYNKPSVQVKINKKSPNYVTEPDLDIVKTEPQVDWVAYESRQSMEKRNASLHDYSYGENANNLASNMLLPMEELNVFMKSEPHVYNIDNSKNKDVGFSSTITEETSVKQQGCPSSVQPPTNNLLIPQYFRVSYYFL